MVDDPDANAGADAAHLGGCAECQARFKTISDDASSIATLLAVPEARVDVGRAFETVMRVPKAQPALGLRLPFLPPRTRPLTLAFVAAVAAAAPLVVAFAAGGFLLPPTTAKNAATTVPDPQTPSQPAAYGPRT